LKCIGSRDVKRTVSHVLKGLLRLPELRGVVGHGRNDTIHRDLLRHSLQGFVEKGFGRDSIPIQPGGQGVYFLEDAGR